MRFLSSLMRRFGFVGDFSEMKQLAEKHALRNDHAAYELALMRFDSGVSFDESCELREFVGSGKGRYTLNSYRKLACSSGLLFEKIYAADSLDWRKCRYFYEQVVPKLGGEYVRVPALRCSQGGNRLVVARLEFVEFTPIDQLSYIDEVVSITSRLASLGVSGANVPTELLDLSLHFGFERCFQKTLGVVLRAGGNVDLLKIMRDRCEALPRFVGHGDLSRPNMGGGALVLDWDNFGFYPPGFDLALALVLSGGLLGDAELEDFARRGYDSIAEHCSFHDFWFSLVFFYSVFLSARKAEHKIYCLELLEGCSHA